jgi:hypothetical protein
MSTNTANTVNLHRVLTTKAERVYRAFTTPGEACYLGWQESLELLAKLVEPEIED